MRKYIHKLLLKASELFEQKPKAWAIAEGHVIVKSFVSGGVQYYMMQDVFNTFCQRALDALFVYEKWNMRCDRKYLEQFVAALDRVLNNKEALRLQDVFALKMQLEDRLNFALPTTEVIYEFASVIFFDENESPYKYDEVYCKEKIKRWKEDMDVPTFFSTIPIRELIPLPVMSDKDLATYLKVLDLVDKKHLTSLQELSSLKTQKQSTPTA